MPRSFDQLIVGSGFAGSLLGMALAERGQSVLIIDRQRHPRFAIGESSTPAADYVLESLCDQYNWPQIRPLCRYGSWIRELPDLRRGLKRGFSYFHHTAGEPFLSGKKHARELLVAASVSNQVADTHWFRADVDQFFARQFEKTGGQLWEEATLESIHRTADRDPHWHIQLKRDGHIEIVKARHVIDGSGADPLMKQAFHVTMSTAGCRTNSRALFGHVDQQELWQSCLERSGVSTDDYPYPCDAAAVHHIIDGGWMWQLRFDHGVTSIGFGLDADRWPLDPAMSPEQEWRQLVRMYPSIAESLRKAIPVAPFSGASPWLRTGRMQRRVDRICGPGWALLPHAAGFIDPFYSTGIAHSLLGVEELAEILLSPSSEQPERWQNYAWRLQSELTMIDRLVALAYSTMGRDPRGLHAASMLYFAAVTTWEKRRRAGAREAFLLADDAAFAQVVQSATHRPLTPDVSTWCDSLRTSLAPWNSVGLFTPAIPNMYTQSAAEKD